MTLIALGPLTNVALALSLEPRLAGALAALIVMGGAVLTYGNASEVASANLYNDPEAAAIVYQSGAPIVQVGLDVCQKVAIPEAHLERLRAVHTPTAQLLMRITPTLAHSYAQRGLRPVGTGVHYNDVPAVAYVIRPELYEARSYHVRIATHDEMTRGQTVADVANRWQRPANATVLMSVQAEALAEMFTSRLSRYEVGAPRP
jgi:inosine-uridine nucleoside N-ribohydrolase